MLLLRHRSNQNVFYLRRNLVKMGYDIVIDIVESIRPYGLQRNVILIGWCYMPYRYHRFVKTFKGFTEMLVLTGRFDLVT